MNALIWTTRTAVGVGIAIGAGAATIWSNRREIYEGIAHVVSGTANRAKGLFRVKTTKPKGDPKKATVDPKVERAAKMRAAKARKKAEAVAAAQA